MKKQKRNHILLWLIAVLLGIANWGCSSKKKTTESALQETRLEHSQEASAREDSKTNIKVDIVTKVDEKSNSISTIKTISPVDPTRPASFTDAAGQKQQLNNAVYKEETRSEAQEHKKDITDQSGIKAVHAGTSSSADEAIVIDKKEVVKQDLERSGFSFWTWFCIAGVGVIGLVLLYAKLVTAFPFK